MKPIFINTTLFLMTLASLIPDCARAASFDGDVAFLKSHTDIIVLSDKKGEAKVAIAPAWQGRVMTSTAGGNNGISFGWINHDFIAAGKIVPHMNAFGGEDRFWMGPEGGQFSIFFAKGAKFEFANWFAPATFDTLPFNVLKQAPDRAVFGAAFNLTNYSGTRFEVAVNREVQLFEAAAAWKKLGLKADRNISLVAYASNNKITNLGKEAWKNRPAFGLDSRHV